MDSVSSLYESARSGAAAWSRTSLAHRRKVLLLWADEILRNEKEAIAAISTETKKLESDARLELHLALMQLLWIAGNLHKALKREQRATGALLFNYQAHVNYQSRGVVLVIGPWNYPIYTPMGQIAGALAAGNSVIFKPSEFTPTAAGFLAKTFAKACKCDEVFQAAVGGARLGSELIQGRPDFICFTGSTATGKKIAAAAAENLIPHILECGGKDAAIITADADLKYAVNQIAWSAFTNHGQSCISTERVIVEAPVFEKVQELMIAAVKKIKAGADYGPATTSAQHQIIVDQLTRGAASGATLLTGDLARLTNPAIEPFVVTGLDIEAELNQEESFGPVITLMPAANRSEAISLANQSRYGLAAAVFAGRGGSAIARQLQCGMVSVNSVYSFAGAAALPFGGVKSSGYGRVHGVEGIRAFANPQSEIKMRFAAPITFTKFHRPESAGAILRVALLLELAIRRRNKAKS